MKGFNVICYKIYNKRTALLVNGDGFFHMFLIHTLDECVFEYIGLDFIEEKYYEGLHGKVAYLQFILHCYYVTLP